MGFFTKLKGSAPVEQHDERGSSKSASLNEKRDYAKADGDVVNPPDGDANRRVSEAAQAGVQRVEATTLVWTKKHLITAYLFIWLIYFVLSIEEVVTRTLTPYVTSAFQLHSLTGTTTVVATIVSGVFKLPLAKILDLWGRPQGLTFMLLCWVLGLIMMAACNNVQTYAAAEVFQTVGQQGVSYCITVFVADTSALKNRGLMLAFATSPYIVTTWMGGPIAESILAVNGPGFRWGFGIFAIVVPVTVLPLSLLFFWAQRKAVKLNLTPAHKPRLTPSSILKFAKDVDTIGMLILATGLSLFLLAFNIYVYQPNTWQSPLIISFITIGGILIIAFGVWEKFFAPVTFIPFPLLADRSVFFGGLMFTFLFASSGFWGNYIYSHLIVVQNLSITTATYISSIYRVGSCGFAVFVGIAIRASGRYKWIALFFAIPLQILAVGLDLQFRKPGQNVGYLVMTQIFLAFAGGSIVICGEMAMLAPSKQEHFAVILALVNLFGAVGSAIGYSAATAIWTGTFPEALARNLPAGTDVSSIFASLVAQISYPIGSIERAGIDLSYYEGQKWALVTSVGLLGCALACVAAWKDIRVKDVKQVKGTVV